MQVILEHLQKDSKVSRVCKELGDGCLDRGWETSSKAKAGEGSGALCLGHCTGMKG